MNSTNSKTSRDFSLNLFFISKILFSIAFVLPALSFGEEKLTFGRFNSRAIFESVNDEKCFSPIVILVPGSGAHGPEEMMPGLITGDGNDHSIFASFSKGLRQGHVNTLAIGKPGVEFFTSWDSTKKFYDKELYQNLVWQDLINNLKDAVDFAKTLPCVDSNKIIILGHSEGTQVAVDFANQYPEDLDGLILVGFSGENLATVIDWQLFRRPIDAWLAPDVDIDHDAFISKDETKPWPEFVWNWLPNQEKVSLAEIESVQRADATLKQEYQKLSNVKLWKEVFHRPAIYPLAAGLRHNLFVYTGAIDVQTRPEEALKLKDECVALQKRNCVVKLLPGLGHGMSAPKQPRGQKLLDMTLGPVAESFMELLGETAMTFHSRDEKQGGS